MDKREGELLKLRAYTEEVDKDLTMILQSLQWDRKHILQHPTMVSCKYDSNHKVVQGQREQHERECLLRRNGYTKEDMFLPDPLDMNSSTLIKLSKEDITNIIENASKSVPTFKKVFVDVFYGCKQQYPSYIVGSGVLEPLTLERLQCTYSADERRAIHDAVVSAAPSCHDLADLALASVGEDAQAPKTKSRTEILAELRDMRRRRTKYRVAAKSRNYSDVLRDVIKTQMEHYNEALGDTVLNVDDLDATINKQTCSDRNDNIHTKEKSPCDGRDKYKEPRKRERSPYDGRDKERSRRETSPHGGRDKERGRRETSPHGGRDKERSRRETSPHGGRDKERSRRETSPHGGRDKERNRRERSDRDRNEIRHESKNRDNSREKRHYSNSGRDDRHQERPIHVKVEKMEDVITEGDRSRETRHRHRSKDRVNDDRQNRHHKPIERSVEIEKEVLGTDLQQERFRRRYREEYSGADYDKEKYRKHDRRRDDDAKDTSDDVRTRNLLKDIKREIERADDDKSSGVSYEEHYKDTSKGNSHHRYKKDGDEDHKYRYKEKYYGHDRGSERRHKDEKRDPRKYRDKDDYRTKHKKSKDSHKDKRRGESSETEAKPLRTKDKHKMYYEIYSEIDTCRNKK